MASEATARTRQVDPAFTEALFKGGELLAAGKVIEAKDHLERAYQLEPNDEKALNLLGLSYFKLGLFERAAEIYENLVRDNPADPTLRVNLGLVYLKSNALNRAIRELEIATDLAPEHAKAHNYLGLALAQAGELGKAREHFLQAGSEAMAEKMARALEEASEQPAPTEPDRNAPAAPSAPAAAEVEVEETEELAIEVEETPIEPVPPAEAAPAAAQENGEATLFEQDWGAQFSDAPEEPLAEELDVAIEPPPEERDLAVESPPGDLEVAVEPPAEDLDLVVEAAPESLDAPVEPPPEELDVSLDPEPSSAEEFAASAAQAAEPAAPPAAYEAPAPAEAEPAPSAFVAPEISAAEAFSEPPRSAPVRLPAKGVRTVAHPLAPELLFPDSADAFEVQPEGAVVRVHDELLVRGEGLMAVMGSLELTPEFQRHHGRPTDKPFGEGDSRLLRAKGQGQILFARGPHWFEVLDLTDDSVYLREERLFGFEEPITYENGRIPAEQVVLELVHLRGEGKVLLKLPGELRTVPVRDPVPVVIPLAWWVGWNGSVLPRVVQVGGGGPSGQLAVELSGEGFALIAVATPEGRIG